MAFGPLGDAYAVSWNDLQDAVNNLYFKAAGTAIPSSNQCIYKALATLTSYVEIDTANSAYVARASNQLLSKVELQPLAPYSFTVYGYNPDGDSGFIDKATACTHSGTSVSSRTIYCNTSTIAAGSRLYYLSGTRYVPYTLPYSGVDAGLWLYNGTNAFPFTMTSHSSNTVASVDTCVTSYPWMMAGGGTAYSTSAAALAASTGGPNLYSSMNGLISGVTTMYNEIGLTTLKNGGSQWFGLNLSGGGTRYAALINSSGVVTSYTT